MLVLKQVDSLCYNRFMFRKLYISILVTAVALAVISCAFTPMGSMIMDHMHEVSSINQHINHAQLLLTITIPIVILLLVLAVCLVIILGLNVTSVKSYSVLYIKIFGPPELSDEDRLFVSNLRAPPKY